MKVALASSRLATLFIIIAMLASGGRANADESPVRFARKLGPKFVVNTSGPFAIISDSDVATVRETLAMANDTRGRVEAFAQSLDLKPRLQAASMTVVLFEEWGGYEEFAKSRGFVVSEAVPGFFDEASNRCYLFNYSNAAIVRQKRGEMIAARAGLLPAADPAMTAVQREQRMARIRKVEAQLEEHLQLISATVVRHEIAHQVLWNLGLQRADQARRRWLKEGLAMQFETADGVNKYRLADWKTIDWSAGSVALKDIVRDATRIGPGAANPQQAYAAAWGLVRYLVTVKPKEFGAYLRATGSWEKSDADCLQGFEEAFGVLDAGFEKECRASVVSDSKPD